MHKFEIGTTITPENQSQYPGSDVGGTCTITSCIDFSEAIATAQELAHENIGQEFFIDRWVRVSEDEYELDETFPVIITRLPDPDVKPMNNYRLSHTYNSDNWGDSRETDTYFFQSRKTYRELRALPEEFWIEKFLLDWTSEDDDLYDETEAPDELELSVYGDIGEI